MFGWRAKIGVLYPSSGSSTLGEWYAWAPGGVTFAPSPFHVVDVLPETLSAREDDLATAAGLLQAAEVDCLVQVGTPFGFVAGLEGDRSLTRRVATAVGAPAVTMMTACIEAMQHLGIVRPALLTAYVDRMNDLLVERLREDGIQPVGVQGLGKISNLEINRTPAATVYGAAKAAASKAPDADGIFLVCGGLPTFEIIETLEQDTSLPAISSNSAGLWSGLRLAGVNPAVPGLGRLYEGGVGVGPADA
jgi:maleate cis-trans isomerase